MFYLELFRALNAAGARHVLVGGVALNLHGVERATMDVDVAIAIDDDNLRRAVEAFRALGLRPIAPVSWDDVLRPGQLDAWHRERHLLALGLHRAGIPGPTVDALVQPAVPFERLFANSEAREVGGVPVRIASIDDLITMKSGTGRAIDASDVAALESLKRIRGSG